MGLGLVRSHWTCGAAHVRELSGQTGEAVCARHGGARLVAAAKALLEAEGGAQGSELPPRHYGDSVSQYVRLLHNAAVLHPSALNECVMWTGLKRAPTRRPATLGGWSAPASGILTRIA